MIIDLWEKSFNDVDKFKDKRTYKKTRLKILPRPGFTSFSQISVPFMVGRFCVFSRPFGKRS